MAQTRLPDELIVVDQSTTRHSGETLQLLLKDSPSVRLIYVWDLGITGLPMARNRGFDYSHGKLVCYLDDDTTPAPTYLAEVDRGFAQFPDWSGLSGLLIEDERPSALRGRAASLFRIGLFHDDRFIHSALKSPRRVRILTGAACSFRREVLEQFRFDETLTGYALGEDFEFCLTAGRLFQFGTCPAARVHHRRSLTGRPTAGELRKMSRLSAGYLWRKHRRHFGHDLSYVWLRFGFVLERLFLPFSGS